MNNSSKACLLKLCRDENVRAFIDQDHSVFQLGSGIRNGIEVAYHGITTLLDMHPDWIAWKLDVSNAYGSMNREHAQSATARFFPSQAPPAKLQVRADHCLLP